MGTPLKADSDCLLVNADDGRRVDKVTEQMLGLRRFVAVADALSKMAIETARHQGQLHVTIDFQGNGTGSRIHVKKVYAVFDIVFDQHASGVAFYQLGCRSP